MRKQHWQSFGELNNTDAFKQSVDNEFKEELIVEDDNKGFLETKAPRRDFLKYLGFSTAAAAVAASCEMPVKKAIPFANKPEDVVPGISKYYATTYVQDGDAVSILAKVRDGRPIKIEGNDLSPLTAGGTSARVQASVLDLYDTARLRFPSIDKNEVTFEKIDKAIAQEIANLGGAPIVILTNTIVSASTKEVITQFLAKNLGSKHVTYDAVSYSGLLLANEASYGKKSIPSYRFDKAKVIVSFSADFLGTWLSPVEFSKQYALGKKIDEKKPEMSKHIHFESVASLTGSNADERFLHRPSETPFLVLSLLNAINGQPVVGIDDKLKKSIEATAKELVEHKGESLVVAGSNDLHVQVIVNAINEALQSNGKTIDWSSTFNIKQGIDAEFATLVADLNDGKVGGLFIYGANPAYTWYDSKKFVDGLKKVKFAVSFNPKADETTLLCKYNIPDHHYLESWGDAEIKTGFYSFLQPTIYPLFKTRQWQDSLLKWSSSSIDYLAFFKQYFIGKTGSETAFDKALQIGIYQAASTLASAPVFILATVSTASSAIGGYKKVTGTEIFLYQKVAIGAGEGTSNPWLQEMPDPITKATWDNYLVVSPTMAKSLLNIDLTNNGQADAYEVKPPKHVVEIKINGVSVKLPTLIIPGVHPNTVGIALGYGRIKSLGKAVVNDNGEPNGANAFVFASYKNKTLHLCNEAVTLADTGTKYEVALTQTHNIYNTNQGNRTEIMKELTLAEYIKAPKEILEEREAEAKPYGGLSKFKEQGTIYPSAINERPGVKWGLSVDLNSCTGCGACVIACNAENNVSVVGKPEVLRGHEMHWMRIDRYYSGNDLDNPKVVFQPLMCQHCDNAPCENVCPVAATNHSSEGLNQMTYNRCIGTRYCANNCPYKVRRFNWADYSGSDSFPNNQKEVLNDVVLNMNDDLTRMVLNPDVTVRARGVIEKCSFCVQRLQAAKLTAKKESRPLVDADIKVACQQSCPTNAIVFGNANDKHSAITINRVENPNRIFYSLEQLHVLPSVSYLAKVRNVAEEGEAVHGAESKHEHKEG